MSYYYVKDGDTHGPASLDELRELCQRGEIPPDTNVCTEGADSWLPLSSLGPSDYLPPDDAPPTSAPPSVPIAAPLSRTPPAAPPSIPAYQYSVVPFVAVIAHREGSTAAASQLQELIRSYAQNGWQYVRLESVETYIAGDNGCFGMGATPPRTTVYSMAVFRR